MKHDTRTLELQVTPKQLRMLEKLARERHCSVSEVVVSLATERLPENKIFPDDIQATLDNIVDLDDTQVVRYLKSCYTPAQEARYHELQEVWNHQRDLLGNEQQELRLLIDIYDVNLALRSKAWTVLEMCGHDPKALLRSSKQDLERE